MTNQKMAVHCYTQYLTLSRINLWAHWARAQGPAPRGAPHLERASKNNQKQDIIEGERQKGNKMEKKGKKEKSKQGREKEKQLTNRSGL